MAPIAARKARQILNNVYKIIAIEMIFAAQALDFRFKKFGRKNMTPDKFFGKGTAAAYNLIRKHITFMKQDRPIYPDIEKLIALLRNGKILRDVENKIGKLN